jgi:protein O-GlcNAc transferase
MQPKSLTESLESRAHAVATARVAVLLAPDSLACRLGLAAILLEAGDVAVALMHYQIAARIASPGDLGVALGLARTLSAAGLRDDASSVCRDAEQSGRTTAADRERLRAAQTPRLAPSADTLALARRLIEEGDRLEAARQVIQALEAFTRCAQLFPGMAPLHYRIGCLLQDLGEAETAQAHYELAARVQPDLFGAAHNAGKLAAGFGQTERARHFLGQANRLRPQDGIVMRLELLTEAVHDSAAAIAETRERFERGLDRLIESPPRIDDPLNKADLPTFYLAYHGVCNRALHSKLARAFSAAVPGLEWEAPHCRSGSRKAGRIRIGFISRFLRTHSIGKVARGLVSRLSREHFEVFVLNIPPVTMDETARWIQAHADHWQVIDGSVAIARQQIAALELDILFYQDIGMEPYSYLLAFSRLAPVQCVSYGHPDTSGIPNMDYYISNDLYEPPGAAEHYSERLVELHALPTLAYYFRPTITEPLPTRAELGLPTDAHLYVCAQSLFKVHPQMDDAMRRILERDGAGRVVLFAGDCAEWGTQLMQRFRRTMPGVFDRIQFLPRQPYQRFLQVLAAADVALDTMHFNGMNTSIDAFSVGTPVVTLPTGLQRGRFTQAMYRTMDIGWGVASDSDEYANLAVDAATDVERQRSLRQLISERSHLLFEDTRTVDEFERFLLTAHRDATA